MGHKHWGQLVGKAQAMGRGPNEGERKRSLCLKGTFSSQTGALRFEGTRREQKHNRGSAKGKGGEKPVVSFNRILDYAFFFCKLQGLLP